MKPIWSFLARAFRRAAIYFALRACGRPAGAACLSIEEMRDPEAFHIEVVTVNETQRAKGVN